MSSTEIMFIQQIEQMESKRDFLLPSMVITRLCHGIHQETFFLGIVKDATYGWKNAPNLALLSDIFLKFLSSKNCQNPFANPS